MDKFSNNYDKSGNLDLPNASDPFSFNEKFFLDGYEIDASVKRISPASPNNQIPLNRDFLSPPELKQLERELHNEKLKQNSVPQENIEKLLLEILFLETLYRYDQTRNQHYPEELNYPERLNYQKPNPRSSLPNYGTQPEQPRYFPHSPTNQDQPWQLPPQGYAPPSFSPQYLQPQNFQPPSFRPQYMQPHYSQPQAYQPQYLQPQYPYPQANPLQYLQPQYSQPQLYQPNYLQPHYPQPQYSQPQAYQPQYLQSQYSQPQLYQPPGLLPPSLLPYYLQPQYFASPGFSTPHYSYNPFLGHTRNLWSGGHNLVNEARQYIGLPVWALTKFASLCQSGNLGCAATVSELLQHSGVNIPGSASVGILVDQLASLGWQRIKISDKHQFHTGDVVFGVKGSHAHIGIISLVDNDQVLVCDNSSRTGVLKERRIESGGSFTPNGRFAGNLYVMRQSS